MKNFFTVLGGMGTEATESYVRLLNKRTPADKDQDYLDYIIVNHATIPDRTAYILDHNQPNFFPDLLEDVKQQSSLQPNFMAIACNTAHYFYDDLQAATMVPILHMPRLAIKELAHKYPHEKRIGLIATAGTLADGVYDHEIQRIGGELVTGDEHVKSMVMRLIYGCIKEKGIVNAELYHEILQIMHDKYECNVIVLGCTELSLAQEKAPNHPYNVIDAQSVLVDKSIELSQAFRNDKENAQSLVKEMLK